MEFSWSQVSGDWGAVAEGSQLNNWGLMVRRQWLDIRPGGLERAGGEEGRGGESSRDSDRRMD